MANEYRIAQLNAEVLYGGGGESRVVHAELNVLHGDQSSLPNARIAHLRLEVLHSDQSSLPNAQIFQTHAEVLMAISQLVSPTFIEDSDGSAEVFEIVQVREIGPPLIRIPDRERNPFPTTIVGLDREEQQRNFRAQHNLAQAGDSTFDYGLLLKYNPDRLYTLGSLGKFYHDDYGIIHARYVQFTQWVDVPFQGCPVGKLNTGESFDWVVTNDFSKSGTDLAQGFTFFADPPPEGSYGWMVVDGANPASISRLNNNPPLLEAEYVWVETGVIHFATPGKVIARRATEPGVIGVGPGTIYIKLEGSSLAAIQEKVTESLSSTIGMVDSLAVRADATESQVTQLLSTTSGLSSSLGQVDARLVRESQARARDIQSIRQELGAVDYSADIQLALDTARSEFQNADNDLGILIADVRFTAEAALAAAGGDSGPFLEQLDSIVVQLGAFVTRLENFRVNYPSPLAGDVLVSAVITSADGVDDVEFVPLAFKLENLFDVDMVTNPPVDGDSIVWDATAQKFVPQAVSGGGGGGSTLDWQLIRSDAISTPTATLEYDCSAYDEVLVYFKDVTTSVGAIRNLRCSQNGGVSWISGGSSYRALNASGAPTVGSFIMSHNTSNSGARSGLVEIHLNPPFTYSQMNLGSFGNTVDGASAKINRIQVAAGNTAIFSNTNFTGGVIAVYGR